MSYCISGQGQEYLGFLNFLVHQTLAAQKKELTNTKTVTYDNVKDWELLDMAGPGGTAGADPGGDSGLEGPVTKGKNKCLMPTDIAEYTLAKFTSNTKAQIDARISTDVAAINTSHGDMTVTNIIFNVGPGTAQYTTGNSVYGAAWLKTAADAQNKVSVSTTIYDKIIASGHKVIHLGWHDLTDDNDHWLRAMARYEAARDSDNDDVTGTKTWDERRGHYARNIAGITFPTTSNDHTVKIDKLLNKDATEYASLCTFLGLAPLSASTWKGYVDSYISDIT